VEEDGQENLCVEGSVTCIGTSIVVVFDFKLIFFLFLFLSSLGHIKLFRVHLWTSMYSFLTYNSHVDINAIL